MNFPIKQPVGSSWDERDKMLAKGYHWCTKCRSFLPVSNFSKTKGAKYGYYWHCKKCQSKSRRNSRARTKARNYNRQLKSYYKRIMGGKCAKCGYDKTQAALDFHHVVPAEKRHTLSVLINSNKHPRIMAEIDKCILLCRNCHSEFNAFVWDCDFIKAEAGWNIKPGTLKEYEAEYWTEAGDKILYEQKELFEQV